MNHCLKKISHVSHRSTRLLAEYDNLYIPRYRNNRLQKYIKLHGVKIWKSIPKELKKLSYNLFKNSYEQYLISLQLIKMINFYPIIQKTTCDDLKT